MYIHSLQLSVNPITYQDMNVQVCFCFFIDCAYCRIFSHHKLLWVSSYAINNLKLACCPLLSTKYFILTVVNCGIPSNITHGQVNHTDGTTFGQTATYTCDSGYNLVGNTTCTCQATGVWSGRSPTCQRMLWLLVCKRQMFESVHFN